MPIEVDALAVTEAVHGDSFRRWQLDFHRPQHQRNPEPGSRRAQGWVIDYLDENDGTSPYLHESFLTAVGPGLPAFATFQPYNENVFSTHDALTDVADRQRPGRARLAGHRDREASGDWLGLLRPGSRHGLGSRRIRPRIGATDPG